MARNPLNYDNWFDYVKLEEGAGDVERVREVGYGRWGAGRQGGGGRGESARGELRQMGGSRRGGRGTWRECLMWAQHRGTGREAGRAQGMR